MNRTEGTTSAARMATDSASWDQPSDLVDKRIGFVGKIAGMSRKKLFSTLREVGAIPLSIVDDEVDIIVFGEEELSDFGSHNISDALQSKAAAGDLWIISETTLWQCLGMIQPHQKLHRMYTPAMLADLLQVPKSIIRRWHRRGLIVPVREVRSLPYFDFHEVATAKQLATMLASGMSPDRIERQLSAISDYLPDVQRPLSQLSIMVQDRDILLRQGGGLVEPGGQMRFNFDSTVDELEAELEPWDVDGPKSAGIWESEAADFEDDDALGEAIRCMRMALQVGGSHAERSFRLAELLYRDGQLSAAIERYRTAVELNPEMVEARGNLGCVLAEVGQPVEAITELTQAIASYPDYCDAHYHLGRILDELGRHNEAEPHWRSCLELNPDSPWADEAYERLNPDLD